MTKIEFCRLYYRLLIVYILRKSLKLVTLKKGLAAFSMKAATTPEDCDKVNQIVLIMQEHLGPIMMSSRSACAARIWIA